jgi:protein O-GlcNAc transferase
MRPSDKIFRQALAAFNNGQLAEAENKFRAFLKHEPEHVGALNLLTVVLMSLSRFSEAEAFIARAVLLNATSDVSFYNYGLILKRLKKPRGALEQFTNALRLNANVAETWNNRGTIFNDLKRYDEAVSDFDRAIALKPDYADAVCNKGKALIELERYREARAAFDQALAIKPDLAEAWLGRGNILTELKSHDDAFAEFDRALALNADLEGAWAGRGNAFYGLKRHEEALAAYDRELAAHPGLSAAWLGRGNVFVEWKSYGEAFAAFDRALALDADLAGAWLGRGNAFYGLKRHDEALAAYDKALASKPALAAAWLGRGNVFFALSRYDEAFAAYDQAFLQQPDLIGVEAIRLHCRMRICDWANLDAESDRLLAALRNGATANPFVLCAIPGPPEDQLNCARSWVSRSFPQHAHPVWEGNAYRHDRIRIGYVSADFHRHATAFLMAGMFESHDRARFETIAISTGPDDRSEMRERLRRSFDTFIDARSLSDPEIAVRIRDAEVDLLVDLKGFTDEARTGVFARRPAPIQVNYLGYPGTMGAGYIDYLMCDRTLVPRSARAHFAEKLVRLPGSYQVNDATRQISPQTFTRAECGLPEGGFVFCCFNNNYKILPQVFDRWMRIMRAIEGSVLWLLEDNAGAAANLRKEAAARGVAPERLVFAARMPLEQHLARHRLAGLFLDTLPYNAHTTASDALWAGLPVLTHIGETFAGRVAASLLNAVGLPELITESHDAYEALAVGLARDPARLEMIKRKLMQTRLTAPLFDTRRTTRHIERAYVAMHERHRSGLPPDHIDVADLP